MKKSVPAANPDAYVAAVRRLTEEALRLDGELGDPTAEARSR